MSGSVNFKGKESKLRKQNRGMIYFRLSLAGDPLSLYMTGIAVPKRK